MPPWAVALIGVGWGLTVLALGFVIRVSVKLGQHDTMAKAHGELLDCIPEMREDIAEMKADSKVFWQVIGPHLSNIIQSPHTLNQDHLVSKFDEGNATHDECLSLSSRLGHAVDGEPNGTMRIVIALKLIQVRQALTRMDRKLAKEQPGGNHQCLQP